MPPSLNQLALSASCDEQLREDLIRTQEPTILRTASRVCRRYLTRSDDEFSLALCAFSRAVDLYTEERGGFLPFAQMLIRRELIDAYRQSAGARRELSVAPHILEGSGEPEEDSEGVYLAVVEGSLRASDHSLRDEIEAVSRELRRYGVRFFELTGCSPRQEKTRRGCAAAIRYLLGQPALLRETETRRRLPLTALAAGSGVPRKTLDRYRKYILMALVVLRGEYPQLAEYLNFVWKEEGT